MNQTEWLASDDPLPLPMLRWFRTLHEADLAAELGGEGKLLVGYCTIDGSYLVDTQDGLDAARCIPPVRPDSKPPA
jgi:hypothetical protein